jgi:hypothetical protein
LSIIEISAVHLIKVYPKGIVAKSGKQFDPEVVGAFKHVVSEKMERA